MSRLLEMQGVSCRLGESLALDNVMLHLDEGCRVALLGANGAGKSTLLRLVAGQLVPSAGQITVDGIPAGSALARLKVGVIPQRTALFANLTSADNLTMFARLSGVDSREVRYRVVEALKWVDLESRAKQPVCELSGGMQRRLSIACGAIHRPRLLLADEPMVGIDAEQRGPVEALLADLIADGTSVIESTHELGRIHQGFNHIAILSGGILIASGDPEQIIPEATRLHHQCRVVFKKCNIASGLEYPGFKLEGNVLTGSVRNPDAELKQLLTVLDEKGLCVAELEVQPPRVEAYIRDLEIAHHQHSI